MVAKEVELHIDYNEKGNEIWRIKKKNFNKVLFGLEPTKTIEF